MVPTWALKHLPLLVGGQDRIHRGVYPCHGRLWTKLLKVDVALEAFPAGSPALSLQAPQPSPSRLRSPWQWAVRVLHKRPLPWVPFQRGDGGGAFSAFRGHRHGQGVERDLVPPSLQSEPICPFPSGA